MIIEHLAGKPIALLAIIPRSLVEGLWIATCECEEYFVSFHGEVKSISLKQLYKVDKNVRFSLLAFKPSQSILFNQS